MKKAFFLAVLLAALPASFVQAAPKISIGSLNEVLDSAQSTVVKRVYNTGDSVAFIKVSAWELVKGSDGKFQEVPIEGADSLVVSPARLIVPPSGMQAVRLLFRGDRDRERYFRLRFNPVMPETGDNFNLSEKERSDYATSLSAGVQMMLGYGMLLYVQPEQVRYATEVNETAERITVLNTGNTTVVLDMVRDCAQGGKCGPVRGRMLAPGAKLEISKKKGYVHSFIIEEGKNSRAYEFRG